MYEVGYLYGLDIFHAEEAERTPEGFIQINSFLCSIALTGKCNLLSEIFLLKYATQKTSDINFGDKKTQYAHMSILKGTLTLLRLLNIKNTFLIIILNQWCIIKNTLNLFL